MRTGEGTASLPAWADDRYPSRVGGRSEMLARLDPVVYPRAPHVERAPLSSRELDTFARDGFLSVEGLFREDEAVTLVEEIEREVAARFDDTSPAVIREPESRQVRSVFYVHRANQAFRKLARDRRLVSVAEQILGSRVYVHQSRVNLKPGFEGKEFYWHSDFETWHVEDGMPRMRAVSVAINLTRNSALNGPLMIMAGSHLSFVACPGRTPQNHHLRSLRRQEYGVPDREQLARLADGGVVRAITGPPGSVVFFDCNAMHGSNGNITPFPRSNVFFVYNSVENVLVDPFSGQGPRPEYVASRDFTPVEAR